MLAGPSAMIVRLVTARGSAYKRQLKKLVSKRGG
jgi:hypothetical protein